jgi:hypothetical protein
MEESKGSAVSYYPPIEEYHTFDSEEEYAVKGREWGLFGKAPKKQFWHRSKTAKSLVTIKGYQVCKSLNVLIIEFEDGNLSSIHPSYLKEMQSSTFGKEVIPVELAETADIAEVAEVAETAEAAGIVDISDGFIEDKLVKKEEAAPKKQKETKEKIELPLDKVKFSARVKEFTTKPNPFSDNDDEILLLEDVIVASEPPLVIGDAWCGYSNTLKAFGLEEGDSIAFEGKVVDKKFNKEIRYKVNNPSKLAKA